MDEPAKSVMVALLPMTTDWCKIELPHMTLVYAGLVDDLKPTAFNEISKDAASLAMLSSPITLQVTGVETFGDPQDLVDVFCLRATSELVAMRRMVEHWNASEFPFKPHATIGPVGSRQLLPYVPGYLAFDRVSVVWGDDQLTFRLKQ
jgi:2'-5' RNA ligase